MKHRTPLIVAVVAVAAFVACEQPITQPAVLVQCAPGTGKDGGVAGATGAGGGHVVPPPRCDGKCCPTAVECFPRGNPSPLSGAECLAQRDNTGQGHWQFRQTMSRSTEPPGISSPPVDQLLLTRSQLPWASCGTPHGTSGFIQLVDIDMDHDTARVGFAVFAADGPTAVTESLCFGEGEYADLPSSVLPPIADRPAGWPDGLPEPLRLPFHVKPATAVRWKPAGSTTFEDFDVAKQRAEILARLDKRNGDLKDYDGVYFIDKDNGVMHGYSPIVFILNYDSATDDQGENLHATGYNAIPIREAEIRTQLNDPRAPNCSGVYLGANPGLGSTCAGTADNPIWGSPSDPPTGGTGPTTVNGYFLVEELEQIHNGILGQSLCRIFPGQALYPGWSVPKANCRDPAKFDPTRHDGFPPGNWCARDDSAAHDDCHDAWRSVSYSTFQAFPIAAGTCKTL